MSRESSADTDNCYSAFSALRGRSLEVELLDERRFDGGMVYLHYRIAGRDEAHQS